jgi:tRNA-splicing ligase RtcB
LADEIQKEVPSGLGRGRKIELADKDIENILKYGAEFLVENGYGEKEDLENCESNGKLKNANPSFVSTLAKKRGKNEVGTLGSGNHFLEIQKVEKVFDEKVAKIFGLFENQVTFMIHTGSRATGHQIASDYINIILKEMPKYNFHFPDKELASIPFFSEIGQRFYSAMCCGANYAFANRQMISFYVRKAVKKILGENIKLTLLYDVAHNIAKIETHEVIINNKKERKKLIVHRKGATRAFPAGNKEIPEKYRKVGQPVLIPGSMGTASYVLVGNEKAKESFYSVSHGSGRIMSRRAALKRFSANEVIDGLKKKGILIKFVSKRSIVEEAPGVYKDIDNVVNIIDETGLAKKVARLKPLAVIKGE